MSEEDLNVKYIREKTGLVEDDELIPIILEMTKDSYKAGLCQAEYDNAMDLMEENQKLRIQASSREEVANKYKEVMDKVKELLGNYKHYSTPSEKQNSDNEDLVNKAFDILKEVK